MDELSPEIKAFLARADQLNAESDEVKQRVRHAVQAGVVAGSLTLLGTAGAQGTTGLKAGLSSFAGAKLWLGAVVISGLGATGWMTLRPEPAPAGRPAVHAAATESARHSGLDPRASTEAAVAPSAAAARPALPALESARSAEASPAAHEQPAARETGRSAQPTAGAADSLARATARGAGVRAITKGELSLLGEASEALASEDAPRALSLLAKHRRRFPATVLRQERAALTLIARCLSGDSAARSSALAFLERNADAILTPRIRRACEVKR